MFFGSIQLTVNPVRTIGFERRQNTGQESFWDTRVVNSWEKFDSDHGGVSLVHKVRNRNMASTVPRFVEIVNESFAQSESLSSTQLLSGSRILVTKVRKPGHVQLPLELLPVHCCQNITTDPRLVFDYETKLSRKTQETPDESVTQQLGLFFATLAGLLVAHFSANLVHGVLIRGQIGSNGVDATRRGFWSLVQE
jgi:hypothetical protein